MSGHYLRGQKAAAPLKPASCSRNPDSSAYLRGQKAGGKAWEYALIPQDVIANNKSLESLA